MSDDVAERVVVSVVIPTYNAADLIPAQLEALSVQTTSAPFEVIVADNGSTDGLVAVVDEWRGRVDYPLRRVDASDQQGVSHARNVGATASRGELILLCDADDAVHPRWIEGHVRALESADMTAGGRDVEGLNSGPERGWRDFPDPENPELQWAHGFLPYAAGANVGMRRAVFEAIDGWDEEFAKGGNDDVDFSWRAQLHGFTLAPAQGAVVGYRLRDTLRGAARQSYNYGRSAEGLYERYPAHGLRPPRILGEVKRLLMAAVQAPVAVWDPVRRGRFVFQTANAWGGVVAITRYRVRRRRPSR
ncbi:glycosyltransferase family A protein [Microbacterium aoyamense]|uniref:Glycosyltransferase family A protein n=1 Tax=Microbacterium aoyamense TaxID=344166 RepID=A0ABP5APP0_9MICO|nr:glycosyltransferase [Microbacterium aoyamense]